MMECRWQNVPLERRKEVLAIISDVRMKRSLPNKYGTFTPERVPYDFHSKSLYALTCEVTGVCTLEGPKKRKKATARQLYFWLCDRFTLRTRKQTAQAVGLKDHTTVHHGIQRIDKFVRQNERNMPSEYATPTEWACAIWEVAKPAKPTKRIR